MLRSSDDGDGSAGLGRERMFQQDGAREVHRRQLGDRGCQIAERCSVRIAADPGCDGHGHGLHEARCHEIGCGGSDAAGPGREGGCGDRSGHRMVAARTRLTQSPRNSIPR